MLDTNIVSALEKAPDGLILSKLVTIGIDNAVTSVIVAGELEYGNAKATSAHLRENLRTLIGAIVVLPLDPGVASAYGRVRAQLERLGKPIGSNDLWIAAHALSLDLTLVTANIDEFSRVEGLRVENWLAA
jgi:tRNA(fMet)-specific endonuclease VapC